jgi:hypothetical protein
MVQNCPNNPIPSWDLAEQTCGLLSRIWVTPYSLPRNYIGRESPRNVKVTMEMFVELIGAETRTSLEA